MSGAPAPLAASRREGQRIVLPGQHPEGRHILSALLKRSYAIRGGRRCTRAAEDRPLVPGDEHFGDPMNTVVQYESDFVPFKLATDVVLNGAAQAPDGRPVQDLEASVTVGEATKRVLVLGDRLSLFREGRAPVFTDPAPFVVMPVRYDLAFGGVDVWSDLKIPSAYGHNHLGRGFMVRNAREVVDRRPLPNIEDPDDRLTPERICCGHFVHMDQLPPPQGFGWIMKYWRPRALLAGVMPADAALARELRATFRRAVPRDQLAMYDQTELPPMDFRFFNGASPGLVLPYLRGDEVVCLRHLSHEAELTFGLPGEAPRIAIDIGAGPAATETVLQTVMIRMEDGEVDLVWRGAVEYPGPDWLPSMRRLVVEVEG